MHIAEEAFRPLSIPSPMTPGRRKTSHSIRPRFCPFGTCSSRKVSENENETSEGGAATELTAVRKAPWVTGNCKGFPGQGIRAYECVATGVFLKKGGGIRAIVAVDLPSCQLGHQG